MRFRRAPGLAWTASALIVGIAALLIPVLAASARADRARVLRDLVRMDSERRDSAAWDRRRDELRKEFLKGAGLWPLLKQGPYGIVRHGLRRHDGYTVENVALETLPGFYCTGNLYRPIPSAPTSPGAPDAHVRGPGVLCPHGHFKPLGRFRPEQQIRCAHLAQRGATVFSYGMVGWQDSTQTTHPSPARGEGGRESALAPLANQAPCATLSPLSPRGRGAGGEGACCPTEPQGHSNLRTSLLPPCSSITMS